MANLCRAGSLRVGLGWPGRGLYRCAEDERIELSLFHVRRRKCAVGRGRDFPASRIESGRISGAFGVQQFERVAGYIQGSYKSVDNADWGLARSVVERHSFRLPEGRC